VKLKPLRRIPVLITLGVILLVCLLRWLQLDYFENWERSSYDIRARYALKFNPNVATNLGFVFIDEDSLRAVWNRSLGYSYGLLWPRHIYGRVVDELSAQGAKAVAFDVIMGELRPDHSPVQMADNSLVDSDEFFALQMRRASNVIIAVTKEVVPPPLFLTNAFAPGDISMEKDPGGVLRRAQICRMMHYQWHPAFRKAEAEYGFDLNTATIQPRQILLKQPHGDEVKVPLDAEGNFDLADFGGKGKARPFTERRLWHMGVVLAARELNLDLDHPEIDLPHGRITLHGPNGLTRTIPVDSEGYTYIDWCMPPNHPQLTEEAIHSLLSQNHMRLEGKTNDLTNRWKGKLAVVGSSAQLGNNLTDRGATPLDKDTLLVSKHWNVANSIITGRFVKRSSIALDFALIAVLGLLAALFTWQFRAVLGLSLVLFTATAYFALGMFLYAQTRYWIPLVLPIFGTCLMTYVCLMTWRVVFEQAERRRIKSVFGTIVSEKIMNTLLESEHLSLGGARRQITVMFADVRGFTQFTDTSQERVEDFVRQSKLTGTAAEAAFDEQARDTLSTINLYLGLVADTLINQDATLDKFIGDCVMAFWGAPLPNPKHAVAAVRAAIQAQRAIEALNQERSLLNEKLQIENMARNSAGLPAKPLLPLLLLGTGINTGMATVGLMGSAAKTRNYTVFGREVNLASRLESASGRGRIFIGEVTFEHLLSGDPELAATCIETILDHVKGFRTAIKAYEVPWRTDSPNSEPEKPKHSSTDSTTFTSFVQRAS
jgi:class 3 adenylate cyclase/CHASE2 domain-containing sensor protein